MSKTLKCQAFSGDKSTMSMQQQITGFLWIPLENETPANQRQSNDVSQSPSHSPERSILTGQPEEIDSSSPPPNPPRKTQLSRVKRRVTFTKVNRRKRSQQTRKTQKTQKSQIRRHAKSKHVAPNSDTQSQSAPPGEEFLSLSNNDTEQSNFSMLQDRSLTDMLDSAFNTTDSNELRQSGAVSNTLSNSSPETNVNPEMCESNELSYSCIQLESQLMSAGFQIESLTDENLRLKNQINLLEDEIDKYKKTQSSLQQHVKKLTVANDDLRREISRQRGLRKFVEPTPTSEVNAQFKPNLNLLTNS